MDWQYKSSVAGIDWPTLPSAQGATILAIQYQLNESQWWSPEELMDYQLMQLQTLVQYARRYSPYYSKHLPVRVDLECLTPDNWRELPILTRKDLQSAGTAICTSPAPPAHGKTFPITTSGSTGRVVETKGTEVSHLFWTAFALREHIWQQRDLSGKLAAIRYQKNGGALPPDGLRRKGWGNSTDALVCTGPAVSLNVLSDISAQAQWLQREDPDYLLTHPSVMFELTRYCKKHNICLPSLRQVRTLAEALPPMLRNACREVWDVGLVDMYSSQEVGYIALQCPEYEHYHVQSEGVLVEVLDQHERPCAPGEIGKVIVTNLHNYAAPLIRYEIGDYTEVGTPCACGRGLPVLKRIMGRYRNLLSLPSGEKRWPTMLGIYTSQDFAPIVDAIQLVQRSLEKIEVRLVAKRPLDSSEREQLTNLIHHNLGYPFQLKFEYVDSIRRSDTGKYEEFISDLTV